MTTVAELCESADENMQVVRAVLKLWDQKYLELKRKTPAWTRALEEEIERMVNESSDAAQSAMGAMVKLTGIVMEAKK